jgi:hypothetical protein
MDYPASRRTMLTTVVGGIVGTLAGCSSESGEQSTATDTDQVESGNGDGTPTPIAPQVEQYIEISEIE